MEIATYLQTSPNATEENVRDHILNLMNNSEYYQFVLNYTNNNPNNTVWWENDTWVSNAENFNLDLDNDNPLWNTFKKELNTLEKALLLMHPIAAYQGYKNKKKAEDITINTMGMSNLNDKSDAFRHALFSALNQRDMGLDILGVSIARKFDIAHEMTTPYPLEKEMDLFNNEAGYAIGSTPLSDIQIISHVLTKLGIGELRHLKPLDFNYSRGISPLTVITPTNQ